MNTNEQIPIELVNQLDISVSSVLTFPYFCFFYVLEGTLDAATGSISVSYHKSDLFLVSPGVRAELSSGKSCQLLLLGISAPFMQSHINMSAIPMCNSVLNPDLDFTEIKRLILRIATEYRSRTGQAMNLMGCLYLLMGAMEQLPEARLGKAADSRYARRVQEIANYIDQHYCEPMSLSDLAQEFYLAPQYLSTFFKEHFSTNFKTYLNNKRLFFSLNDLRETQLSINDIALKNGFTSVSAYRKNFEAKYHVTPSQFRKKHKNKQIAPELPGSIPLPELTIDDRKEALHQIIRLDTEKEPEKINHTGAIINIGSASNLLQASYRASLKEFLSGSNIAYVRLQDVLSSSFIPMLLPNFEFYFRNVTTIITFLFELGLTPIIELSRGQFNFALEQGSDDIPRSSTRGQRFFRLLEAFMQHVSSHWPLKRLENWKFEIWMQPGETLEAYADSFVAISTVIRKYIPKAMIGGPGYHKCTTGVSADDFMQYFSGKRIRLDFFSIYLDYRDFDRTHTRTVMSLEKDYLIDTCREIRYSLNKHMPGTPLYATEWSSLYLPNIPLAHSRYQAAFIAHNYLRINRYCDLAGYWLFSDHQFKSMQQMFRSSEFMNGVGLCNADLIPTAAYYAYQLCNRLGNRILTFGTNYCLVLVNEHHYQLLACNYVHPKSPASPEFSDNYSYKKVYSLFTDDSPVYMHFYLDHIKRGLYQIRRHIIDKSSGNMLDVLIGASDHSNIAPEIYLQKIRSTHPDERDYYSKAFLPEIRKIYTKTEGSLCLEAFLVPHAVCLWDVQLQL